MSHLLLSDYGLIGNQASAALVSRLGSIDWCCLPFLDSPSHFGALLDQTQGGRFQIAPQGDFRSEQRYLQRTHVLETLFETPHGRAVLTDWMPMDEGLNEDPVIFRRIEIIDGRITWQVFCAPRFGYGEHPTEAERHHDGILFRGRDIHEITHLHGEAPLEITPRGDAASGRITLEAGQSASFVWAWGRRSRIPLGRSAKPTAESWREWAHRCPPQGCLFAGPWHDAVTRSGLVLKLLTASYSGALAEAVTTSLPAVVGGSRTWDYRYAWIRDGAFTIQALSHLGYREEAARFFSWIADIVIRDGAEGLQPVYTLDGGRSLPERELDFLAGYQGSRPVRVGNLSAQQFHLDIYGHVALAAAEHFRNAGSLPAGLWPRLSEIAEYVCQAWRRPDHGPWEVRSRPEHFVSSKVMCWATLDRACWLARALREKPPARWLEEREVLHRTICQQGYDERQRSFVRSFGDSEFDASSLLIPLVGFLPIEDVRVQGTLDALQAGLSQGVLMYRYRAADGVSGPDGAHIPTSFLFASCLALSGRADEAGDRLAELCTFATPLGLFGEQINQEAVPGTLENAGNFPCAGAHLALLTAALYVGAARRRLGQATHLIGQSATDEAHRQKRPSHV